MATDKETRRHRQKKKILSQNGYGKMDPIFGPPCVNSSQRAKNWVHFPDPKIGPRKSIFWRRRLVTEACRRQKMVRIPDLISRPENGPNFGSGKRTAEQSVVTLCGSFFRPENGPQNRPAKQPRNRKCCDAMPCYWSFPKTKFRCIYWI